MFLDEQSSDRDDWRSSTGFAYLENNRHHDPDHVRRRAHKDDHSDADSTVPVLARRAGSQTSSKNFFQPPFAGFAQSFWIKLSIPGHHCRLAN